MKGTVPKFVIAKNEAASPGAAYVVHTQEPSFIAEVKHFHSIDDRDIYISGNQEAEIIVVNRITVIEIKKYLESSDREKRRTYLNNKLKHWVIANCLNTES
jgi:hypothetical protein